VRIQIKKFNRALLIQGYICDKICMKILSAVPETLWKNAYLTMLLKNTVLQKIPRSGSEGG